ncbi:hypothetical protein ABZP36_028848, partial [Zizania latifolia]
MCCVQESGRTEADFGRHDVRRVVRTIYILFSGGEIPPLPPWFTEQDLDAYASLYENSGFRFPLQMPYSFTGTHRRPPSIHKKPHLVDAKFEVP